MAHSLRDFFIAVCRLSRERLWYSMGPQVRSNLRKSVTNNKTDPTPACCESCLLLPCSCSLVWPSYCTAAVLCQPAPADAAATTSSHAAVPFVCAPLHPCSSTVVLGACPWDCSCCCNGHAATFSCLLCCAPADAACSH
jgi:hypothetical protein